MELFGLEKNRKTNLSSLDKEANIVDCRGGELRVDGARTFAALEVQEMAPLRWQRMIAAGKLSVRLQPHEARHRRYLPLQFHQHEKLHVQDVGHRSGFVGELGENVYFERLDFLRQERFSALEIRRTPFFNATRNQRGACGCLLLCQRQILKFNFSILSRWRIVDF